MSWTGKKAARPVYEVVALYCDLGNRKVVKVYATQSEETKQRLRMRGRQFMTRQHGGAEVGVRAYEPGLRDN